MDFDLPAVWGRVRAHDPPEQDVINRRQDHVHLEEPDFLSILRWTGHPGGDSDTVLRAIGVPEEML